MSRPAIARLYLDNLRHNYRLLRQQAGKASVMSVVKADAYGHGMHSLVPVLLAEECQSFGVTDAAEGSELRAIAPDAEISLLSGIFDREDAELARIHQLTPALTGPDQVRLLTSAGFSGKVWIKLDTGMKRLGAEPAGELLDACNQAGIDIAGLLSHLACADEPGHPQNMAQVESFQQFRRQLGMHHPTSLLNSAGMLTLTESAGDVVRPGIALYGAEPVPSMPLGLKPVMQLCGRVMQVRELQAGDSVSYGATFKASHSMRIATVSIGYADGLPRHLSNIGFGSCKGHRLPIVGRICMDYTIVDIDNTDVSAGDDIEFWGETLSANEVAELAGTISYTLFAGVGPRVRRLPVP